MATSAGLPVPEDQLLTADLAHFDTRELDAIWTEEDVPLAAISARCESFEEMPLLAVMGQPAPRAGRIIGACSTCGSQKCWGCGKK